MAVMSDDGKWITPPGTLVPTWGMFSAAGNFAVDAMVKTARLKCRTEPEPAVIAWIRTEKERIEAACHGEVSDTMVREMISWALDEAWTQAYGHAFDWADEREPR